MKPQKYLFVLLILFAIVFSQFANPQSARAACAPDHIIYVRLTGTNAGGCTWVTAFTTVQSALAIATSGDQIWVAAGTYFPDEGTGQVNNARTSTYQLLDGVTIYGGFSGLGTETLLNQRNSNPATNNTILSGDIGTVGVDTDNAFIVVTVTGILTDTFTLDGFTITDGYEDSGSGQGGGIYIEETNPTLANLIVTNNFATSNGGGIYMITVGFTPADETTYNRPTLTNVTISNNTAARGGGMYTRNSSPILTDVTFNLNDATGGAGGGMNNQTNSTSDAPSIPRLNNVTFSNNIANGGGGIFNGDSNSILTNVTFSGNTARIRGGAVLNEGSNPVFRNVTFSGNTAPAGTGGAIRNVIGLAPANKNTNPFIFNNILWGDTAGGGNDEITSDGNGITTITDSVVENGCQPVGSTCTNIITTNPNLGALLLNAPGLTQTMAIGAGSSALNTGGVNVACAATDQRGISRPQEVACDIGAYEIADTTPPILNSFTRFNPLTTSTNADTLVFRIIFNETVINVDLSDFVINGTSATPTFSIITAGLVFQISLTGGDLTNLNGPVSLNLALTQNITDTTGNALPNGEPATDEVYDVDNTAPIVSIGAPSVAITTTGPVDFPITVTGANTINLLAANVTLNTTGTATGTISVTNGTTATPTVTISAITGNGTIGISIAAAVASDLAGNTSAAAGPSVTFIVDNTAPIVSIGAPSVAITTTGPVDFPITVTGANTINLLAANVTLNTTGTATGTISVTNGTTATPTVTISAITGNGTIGISIAAAVASDLAGNTSAAAGPSATFIVDNTAPIVSIGAPSVAITTTGPVDFPITVTGANTINLLAANVTLNTTGTATGTISVTNGTTATPTVTISAITGNGTIGISIAAAVASDLAGNTSAAAGPSTTFIVDNTAPIVSIGAPSVAITTTGPVDFPITVTGANTINLLAANVTLNTTGTATGTISVTNGTTATPTVTISAITGNGTIGISIAAAVASDLAGNTSAAAGPSATFIVDNTAPIVSIGAPSVAITTTGPVDFPITVTGANTINLLAANVTLNTTGTATGTISVTNGTTATPTVTISAITGNGTIGISIAAAVASDLAGNTSAAAGPSTTFIVDNTAPIVSIGAPSVAITTTGPVDFPITVTGANTINLLAANVTLNTTGTATGTISVTNGTTATPTVTISAITGNGTIGISIAAAVASDLAGNTSAAAGPSTTFIVDNTAPIVSIGAPSVAITTTGPVDFPITVTGANTINLLAANVTLNTTGTATGTISVTNGTTATPTVTISAITGNGTIGISIAAAVASDLAGNTSAAAGPSATFIVDNTAPIVSIGAPSVAITTTGPVDFPITVTGANTINLLAANVTLNTTGTATGTISVTNGTTATPTVTISAITGNGTIGISSAAAVASDLAGNTSAAAGPSATFIVDNTAPTVTTQAVTAITATTATGNGTLTVLGVPNPTAHGVVWSLLANPTTADGISDLGAAAATGAFTAPITGLTPNTLYHVRAFATNTAGTSYGADVTFTTTLAPTVTTQAVTAITTTTATGNGTLTVLGVPNPTAHGVVWSLLANPTTLDSVSDLGAAAATGAFTAPLTGLTPNTLYHVRAFATNTAGTVYGADVTFTTVAAGNPTVVSTTLTASYTGTGPESFIATFSKAVDDPAGNTGTDDVTNPANYLLVNKGTNGVADTLSCAGGVVADDTQVAVTNVSYNNITFTSTVTLASSLPAGTYRLFICGTTSIVDLVGNPLNGGTDYTFDFAVQSTSAPALPDTGFLQNQITVLPIQTADKAYASTDLWLEIPKLGIKMSIVGVPQIKNDWDVTWLDKNAGWLNGSAYPTWKGNSVITAHVWDALNKPGPFAGLKDLKYGDQIKIHAFGQVFTYELRETKIISPTNTAAMLKHEEKSWLTLITCEDYKELTQKYSYRRMVRAVLVSVTTEK